MLNEHLTQLWANTHNTEHSSVRLTESLMLSKTESVLFRNALFLWCALLSEKASAALDESSFRSFRGRNLNFPAAVLSNKAGIAPFLSMLDEVEDIIISVISSDSSHFKGEMLLSKLRCFLSKRSSDLWRMVSPLLHTLIKDGLDAETVSFLRQLSNLLSKLSIDRSDLHADYISAYKSAERVISSELSYQKSRDDQYWHLVLRIRDVLRPFISSFEFDFKYVRHGPGAVANPFVKTQMQKFSAMEFDSRVNYLLKGDGLEQADLSPLGLIDGDRTSRVIFVPKTWKKLRGISAEPVGLQFFQQAVFLSMQRWIRRSFLHSVIDLRNQDKSRSLAKKGSRDGTLSTIDLSSASDSVTLQLVKDVFGNSLLCRWLLATRSTHTLIGNERLEISKFAPMGSACCFPVECVLFAGASLATVTRDPASLSKYQVFGDDIICPSTHASEIIDNLRILGFVVNSDKTFISGDYRESCGMDAWRGFDVTPLKLKDFSFDFNGSKPLSYDHHSRIVSYLNFLYAKGYKATRSFLLKKLLNSKIFLGKEVVDAGASVLFGAGAHGTICTTHASNFHLVKEPLRGLFRHGYRLVVWKPRRRRDPGISEADSQLVLYQRWLLKNSKDSGPPVTYDLHYFQHLSDNTDSVGRSEVQMVPTYSLIDPWYDRFDPLPHRPDFPSSLSID